MENFWTYSKDEVIRELKSDKDHGLSQADIQERLQKFGPNRLNVKKHTSRWLIFWKQFNNPVVYILVLAAIVTLVVGEHIDSMAILAIVILNTVIGFVQEVKAEASMEALAKISSPKGKVLRDGEVQEVDSASVCPGDILVLEAGDYVVADARLLSMRQFAVDESILTGESLPVEKHLEPLEQETALADRKNSIFAGTAIGRGTGTAIVVATGKKTEIGKIAGMMESTKAEMTPLQKRLEIVSHRLLMAGLLVIGLVVVIGLVQGRDWMDILMTGLSLAISAIPEGLPTVVTIALVMAIRRMSRKKALIRKMDSVETLGATDIICTDKTGTLTTGKMKVREHFIESERDLFFHCQVLCNNASINGDGTGDTTELALLYFCKEEGIEIKKVQESYPRTYEWSFDSDRKMMSVANQMGSDTYIFSKGAPEILLGRCLLDSTKLNSIENKINEFSQKGMRVLALAGKKASIDNYDEMPLDKVESELNFLGLVALADPPRQESIDSIEKCQKAGIRVIMITGDHPETAVAIAHEIKLIPMSDKKVLTGVEIDKLDDESFYEASQAVSVYARVSPENKLRLINTLKSQGHIVAMTGDGVNDAPALKSAAIGVAMGKGGTEVARQASSMILTDDNFATIVDAVEEGRSVNGNIKRTLQYLLSTNLAELLFILGATIVGWPVPLLPVNILWLNLVTDGLPSLALAAETVPDHYLETSRRPSSDTFFDRLFYEELLFVSVIITIMSIGVYHYGLKHFDVVHARTLGFSFLVYVVLFRSFSCRSEYRTFFELKLNLGHLVAVLIPVILQLMLQKVPFLQEAFKMTDLTYKENLALLFLSLIPVTLIELIKLWRRR